MIFGRQGGPARGILAVVALLVLITLGVTVARLNTRLANQERANQETLAVSRSIVNVNDRVTQRLHQLDELTGTANQALDETRNLAPLLEELQRATKPAADAVAVGRAGGEVSQAKLTEIESALAGVKQHTLALVQSAQVFGGQGKELLGVVQGLISDIEGSVAAAKRINNSIPVPG